MESMNDYNDKVNTSFVEQIDELRSYSEQTMNEMRRHQHDVFEKKFNGLFEVFNKYCDTTETNRKHVKNLKKSVQAEIKDNINLKSRIKALEKQLYVLEQDKIENDLNGDKIIDLKNEEINVLKQTISEQINEYNNILEINASMSNDLNLYKSMLESEECRLGISYKPGEKRKRNGQLNGTHSMIDFSFKNDFNILSSNRENFVYLHSGSLSIKHVNQMGWFVSIENCSSDQINLSGYQLKQYNSEKSVIYSFKDKKLLPEQILNIWSFNDIPNIKCDKLNVKFDEGGWIQFSQEDKINFVLLDKSNTEISLAYASKHPSFKKMDDLDRKKCSVM
ncbi:hypothetical protein A3Q56_05788 [Intoshia linei]|uniref:IF rod domain-containing protein n=1 Tax=Intoshia linei TaxID=1819745 RepID=A0A177AZ91_9BILA|nr:hypothetical protein A3Q56_05788 [Intoshia linei]